MMDTTRMNPSAERALHDRNYPAWLTYAAPRVAAIIQREPDTTAIARSWSLMSRDMQRAVWASLDEATRDRVRDARGESSVDHFREAADMFVQHMEKVA